MKRGIILLVCALLFVRCNKLTRIAESQIGKEEKEVFILPKEDDFRPFDLSPYLDSVKYVKLELKDESIIGQIDKLIVYDERIYILDTQTSSLFVFDMEGYYIHKISAVGNGPGEYVQLDFFDIDRDNQHIVLTDLMSYWIMHYDFNGKFLFRKKIPLWCEGVSVLPNKGYVLYSNFRNNSTKLEQEFNLVYLDSAMNFKQAYFPYNSKEYDQRNRPPASMRGQFYAFEDNLNFTFPGGNTVYQVTHDSLINKYQFDFGKEILNVENPTNLVLFNELLTKNRYNGFISSVMENDNFYFFMMNTNIIPSCPFNVFYSKRSGQTLSTFTLSFDDLFYFIAPFQTGYNSWVVSEIQSHHLVGSRDSYLKNLKHNPNSRISEYTKQILKVAEKTSEDDNSVLMFYKLKPF